jgi:hypothetical protein
MRATISLLRNGFEEEAVTFGYPRERVFRQAARVRCGSIASVWRCPSHFRFSPDDGDMADVTALRICANR